MKKLANPVCPFSSSSVEVAFEEGPVNLNWSMIMKTVNEDPAEFYRNGGWNFLGPGSDVSIDNWPCIKRLELTTYRMMIGGKC